jgi:hypothetical protein
MMSRKKKADFDRLPSSERWAWLDEVVATQPAVLWPASYLGPVPAAFREPADGRTFPAGVAVLMRNFAGYWLPAVTVEPTDNGKTLVAWAEGPDHVQARVSNRILRLADRPSR